MHEALKKFEYVINAALLLMLAMVLLLATIDLGWFIVKSVLTAPVFVLEVGELLELFGAFLLVLIGVELLNTVKAYVTETIIHVEVVLVVGIIAIARKVVILEPEKMDALTLLGIAAIIFALTLGYYLLKISARKVQPPNG